MGSVVAIDIGGTTIKSAVALRPASLAATSLSDVRRTPTPVGDPKALTDAVIDLVRSYGDDVDSIGVVMPGLLDVPNGRVRIAGNLRLQDAAIVEPLAAALRIPIAFDHDVRAGALAELHAGAARGLENAAFLAIGTGIAAAFVIDGEVRSSDGFMGEVGHQWVGIDAPCICGLRGCLEAVSSASGIARRYSERTGNATDAASIIASAASGDTVAAELWHDAVQGLVRASAMIANLLAPEAIIVGGGLALAGDALFEPLRTGLAASISFQRLPHIREATHGDDAGCLGAAIAALRQGGLS